MERQYLIGLNYINMQEAKMASSLSLCNLKNTKNIAAK